MIGKTITESKIAKWLWFILVYFNIVKFTLLLPRLFSPIRFFYFNINLKISTRYWPFRAEIRMLQLSSFLSKSFRAKLTGKCLWSFCRHKVLKMLCEPSTYKFQSTYMTFLNFSFISYIRIIIVTTIIGLLVIICIIFVFLLLFDYTPIWCNICIDSRMLSTNVSF